MFMRSSSTQLPDMASRNQPMDSHNHMANLNPMVSRSNPMANNNPMANQHQDMVNQLHRAMLNQRHHRATLSQFNHHRATPSRQLTQSMTQMLSLRRRLHLQLPLQIEKQLNCLQCLQKVGEGWFNTTDC